jgi:hypothetical protein
VKILFGGIYSRFEFELFEFKRMKPPHIFLVFCWYVFILLLSRMCLSLRLYLCTHNLLWLIKVFIVLIRMLFAIHSSGWWRIKNNILAILHTIKWKIFQVLLFFFVWSTISIRLNDGESEIKNAEFEFELTFCTTLNSTKRNYKTLCMRS